MAGTSKSHTKVAVVKAKDRREGVRRSIELLDANPVKGKEVILKPNFNTADPFPGSTHPDTLRELIVYLKEMGAKKITVGERSGPPNTAQDKYSRDAELIWRSSLNAYKEVAEDQLEYKCFEGGHAFTEERFDYILHWAERAGKP